MRIRQITVLLLVLAVILSGCQFGMIETVQIKADPTIQLSLGTRADVLSELDDMLLDMTDSEMISIGSFTPNQGEADEKPTMKAIIIENDVFNFSIDEFADESLELGGINQNIPADKDDEGTPGDPIEFTVPTVSMPAETISLPLSPVPLSGVDDFALTVSMVEYDTTLSLPAISAGGTVSGFTSITFDSGTLTGSLAAGTPTVTIESASLRESDGTTIIADSPSGMSFDLAGKTLPNDFTVVLEVSIAGSANDYSVFTRNLDISFTGCTVSSASGIEVSKTQENTTTMTVPSDVVSATVGAGTINLDFELPSGWTNLEKKIDIRLEQGGTPIATLTNKPLPLAWDLTDANNDGTADDPLTFAAGDIDLVYTVRINTAASQTSDIDVGSGDISVSAEVSITEFESLVVSVSSDLDLSLSESIELDSTVTDLVSLVTFSDPLAMDPPEISITLNNGLPVPIQITIDSTALGIASLQQDFDAPASAGDAALPTTNTWELANSIDIEALALSYAPDPAEIDVNVTVDIDGYNSGTGTLTITDLDVSEERTYSLSGNVSSDLSSVYSVDVKNASISGNSGDPMNELSMLDDYLPDTLSFEDFNAAVKLQLDSDDPMTLDLMAWVNYSDDGGTTYKNLSMVGDDADSNGIPETTEQFSSADSIDVSNLITLINDRATGIVFHYSATVSNATITLDPDATEEQAIAVVIQANVPLHMYASADTLLTDSDGANLIPAIEDDLFGRTADDDSMEDYLEFFKNGSITVTFDNKMDDPTVDGILGMRLSLTEATSGFSKDIDFIIEPDAETSTIIQLTKADMDLIIDDPDSSFEPVFELYLLGDNDSTTYNGHHVLYDNINLSVGASMEIQSEIDTTLEELTGGDE